MTNGGTKTTLQTRIREYRQVLSLTQEQLAKIVGVTRQTILFLEKGKYNPSLRLAYRIARVLKKSIDEIFLFDDEDFDK